MHYDVFNGDADGIIALLQLRLSTPKEHRLITGVKRDIKLLEQVVTRRDATSVTVLDISMMKNIEPLQQLLTQRIPVFYCDHHQSGTIPDSEYLETLINLDAETCTSLLINQQLKGKFVHWAIAGAFGDNLHHHARSIANREGLSPEDTDFLCELGTLINYNGYGATLDDLHMPPAELFQQLLNYPSPFMLREDPESPYYLLQQGYADDYAQVTRLIPLTENQSCRIFELPSAAWARRISGVFGNELANQRPELAHAVLTLNENQQDYTVSVRAPLKNRTGADDVCSLFATGGGRKAAAGINALPCDQKSHFIDALTQYYQSL
ncbi:acetyltransferase [Vibrio gazogenes]|uniref:Acetyltransferase n=1 Tax=Vibrio gazogenes TaxID=687 RepID=A0A1Z2SFN0_VIBGA|nr:acetyltransferase [Vibrio gazogenes]ASA55955.1 acetyltransferase [Vibrio gazogenes]